MDFVILRLRFDRVGVAATTQIESIQPFPAQDHFPAAKRQPEDARAGTDFDQIVEVVSFHVPGEILDRISIEGDIGTKLKQAKTFVRLAVANPARITTDLKP